MTLPYPMIDTIPPILKSEDYAPYTEGTDNLFGRKFNRACCTMRIEMNILIPAESTPNYDYLKVVDLGLYFCVFIMQGQQCVGSELMMKTPGSEPNQALSSAFFDARL